VLGGKVERRKAGMSKTQIVRQRRTIGDFIMAGLIDFDLHYFEVILEI
jgi:hypothetical protein